MKQLSLVSIFIFISLCTLMAQGYFVSGIVLDSATRCPQKNAWVLIDGTTHVQLTDSSGTFKFALPDKEPATVIVAKQGYQTEAYEAGGDKNISMRFYLFKSNTIPANTQETEKNMLHQYQSLFLQSLLGYSTVAQACEIVNPYDLRFWVDQAKHRITVSAVAPVQIINEPMGYLLTIIVDDFTFSLKGNVEESNVFIGFKSLSSSNPTVLDRWKNNKLTAYKGSFMQFIRALYTRSLEEEGFSVALIKRVYEDEPGYDNALKLRDAKGEEQIHLPSGSVVTKKYADVIDNSSQAESSLARFDSASKEWRLNNRNAMLRVMYKNYLDWFNDFDAVEKTNPSYAYLLAADGKPVSLMIDHEQLPCTIYKSGKIKMHGGITILGYWSRHDLATSLPYDYRP